MLFFKRKNSEIEQLKSIIYNSFTNVKQDTQLIFDWLNYLYQKNQEQEQLINSFQKKLDYMPKTRQEIKQIIDYYYSHDHILSKIKDLNERIDSLTYLKSIPSELDEIKRQIANLPKTHIHAPHVEEKIDHIHKRMEKLEQKKPSFKEKLVQKITRRSKEYVKSVIISYIKKYHKISALQLKEMLVDEQTLCSKSSFYRLLNEIEQQEDISVIQKGKEKHYLAKAIKYH